VERRRGNPRRPLSSCWLRISSSPRAQWFGVDSVGFFPPTLFISDACMLGLACASAANDITFDLASNTQHEHHKHDDGAAKVLLLCPFGTKNLCDGVSKAMQVSHWVTAGFLLAWEEILFVNSRDTRQRHESSLLSPWKRSLTGLARDFEGLDIQPTNHQWTLYEFTVSVVTCLSLPTFARVAPLQLKYFTPECRDCDLACSFGRSLLFTKSSHSSFWLFVDA